MCETETVSPVGWSPAEIDYMYLIGELQDVQSELEQADARMTRIERALAATLLFHGPEGPRHILESPLSDFTDR